MAGLQSEKKIHGRMQLSHSQSGFALVSPLPKGGCGGSLKLPPMHKTQTKLSHPNSRDDHIGFAQQVIFFCHARKFCNLGLITVKETSKQGSCQSQIEFSVHGRTIMPEPGKLMAELHAFPTQSPWQDCSPKRKSMAGCNSATVNQALRLCPRFPSGE